MTHFRFRCRRVGYLWWRCRAVARRASALLFVLPAAARSAPGMAAWRHAPPVALAPAAVGPTLRVGDFVVSAEGDPRLTGHPDIRY